MRTKEREARKYKLEKMVVILDPIETHAAKLADDAAYMVGRRLKLVQFKVDVHAHCWDGYQVEYSGKTGCVENGRVTWAHTQKRLTI